MVSKFLSSWSNILWIRIILLALMPVLTVYCFVFQELTVMHFSLILIGFFLFDSLGVQIGCHKLFSHRSFETFTWVEILFGYFAVMSGQGSPIWWVAVHRGLHHRYTDKEQDPHSPNKGFFHSFIGWSWRLRKIPIRAVSGLLKKKYMLFYHRFSTFIFTMTWLLMFLTLDFSVFVCLFVIPSTLSVAINGLMSYFLHREKTDFFDLLFMTYRTYNSQDNSKNSLVLGMLTFGTGFHNNHHMFPDQSNNAHRWFELDPSVFILPLISKRITKAC